MPNFLYLDIETQRTADEAGGFTRAAIRRRGLSVAVTWREASRGYRIYHEQDCPQLISDMKAAECVVGFGCRPFDYEVIRGHFSFRKPRTLDLLDVINEARGFRVGLTPLALGTFGRGRSSDGNRNTALWQAGDGAAVERACQRDVALIRRLHEHMMQTGSLAYKHVNGTRQEFEVPASMLKSHTR